MISGKKTFEELHEAIQIMGNWGNYHLYRFDCGNGLAIERPNEDFPSVAADPRKTRLSQVFGHGTKNIHYNYDFGDDWELLIKLETISSEGPSIPVCLAGKRSFPPEDCGGYPGYVRLLDILCDKKNPEYERKIEWLGGSFNPEECDLNAINQELKKHFSPEKSVK